MKQLLYAPKEFWDLPEAQRQGRCGPGEGLGDKLVPDHILGVKITPACSIHDYMFKTMDGSYKNFKSSNRVFLYNMYRLIERESDSWNPLLKYARRALARFYYRRVAGPVSAIYYWSIHNDPEEMGVG